MDVYLIPEESEPLDLATYMQKSISDVVDHHWDVIVCDTETQKSGQDPLLETPLMSREDLLQGAMDYAFHAENMISSHLYPVLASTFIAQHCAAPQAMYLIKYPRFPTARPQRSFYDATVAASHHLRNVMGTLVAEPLTASDQQIRQAKLVRKHRPSLDRLTTVGLIAESDWEETIASWVNDPLLRPHAGSLVSIRKHHEETSVEIVA